MSKLDPRPARPWQLAREALLASALLLAAAAAPAHAAEDGAFVQQVAYSALLVCVQDEATRMPLAGVRLLDAGVELLATTDQAGRASIPARCCRTDVVMLQCSGYPIVLLPGSKLSPHSLVTMKQFTSGVPAAHFDLL